MASVSWAQARTGVCLQHAVSSQGGEYVYIAGALLKNSDDTPELQILICCNHPETVMAPYKKRWQIERCFRAMKSSGFNIEDTHLRDIDRIKYRIHDAVKAALAACRSWSELDKTLNRHGVRIRFRYDTMHGRIISISFTVDGCTFSGSKIDRTMSYYAIDRQFGGCLLEADEQRIPEDSEQYRQRFAELAQSGRLVAPRFVDIDSGQAPTDSRRAVTAYSEGGNGHTFGDNRGSISNAGNATDTVNGGVNGAVNAADAVGNIIQITVATFIELAVQPHQARISSGGGGGSDQGGWDDNGNEKDKLKPRKRRR